MNDILGCRQVYRRAGTLELGKGLLDAAEAAGVAAAAGGRGGGGGGGAGAEGNAGVPPGELFCRALFTWFSGSPRQACHMFGNLRHDEEWGLPAVYHMLDICIDQDDLLACDVPKSETPDPDDDHDVSLKVASRLLAELRSKVPKGSSIGLRNRILENLLLLASKRKASIQRATDDFVLLMKEKENKDNVTVALGMAIALVLGKNVSRAKHILKRFVKFDWNVEDSADLERSWLLLAILYVQKGKHGTANKLLKRILGHNKGYCKAYQYAGVIAEKEQYYSEAAKQYQNAWKFGGYSNPQIAYRMAYNYMKDRKYVQALDTCQTIKKLHPGFADTCLDIVEICRNNLRT
ncbi:hypothetical protein R5R35_011496 [Gryllus longicercus]|uniref:Uncharacterized protein n=1 Tax=Gryllus longicercus TaxID=2509291 RepID=A0AAN9YZD9_9ORTH